MDKDLRVRTLRQGRISFLPNDNILDWTKLKAFADDKLKVARMMISLFDRVEDIAVTSIFFFSTMFSKAFFLREFKSLVIKG